MKIVLKLFDDEFVFFYDFFNNMHAFPFRIVDYVYTLIKKKAYKKSIFLLSCSR